MKRRLRPLPLLLTLCLSLAGQHSLAQQAASTASVAEQKTTPNHAIAGKNCRQALPLLDAQLKQRPQDLTLLRQKAACLGKLNRETDAVKVMREITKLTPNDETAWNDLCWHLMLASGPQKAQVACERSVSIRKNAINTANLGHTYLLTAESKTAYRWYRESVQLLKNEQELTGSQGPITAFNRFIKNGWLTNESRKARAWMQNHFWARQNAEGFIKRATSLAQSIDAHPERYRDASGKNNDAAYKRDNAEVIALLEKSRLIVKHQRGAQHPKSIEILQLLAQRQERVGQYAKAEALLHEAMELAKKNKPPSYALQADILEQRIALHMHAHAYRKVLPFINELIALTAKTHGPGDAKTIAMMKRFIALHQAAGGVENELALRLRLMAVTEKHTPPTLDELKRIAKLYAYTDDFDRAAQYGRRAKAMEAQAEKEKPQPSAPVAQIKSETELALERAWRAHDWPLAIKQVDLMIAAQPNNDTLYRWKAYFLAQSDKHAEASDAYQKSIALQPKNPHAWNGLCWQFILQQKLPEAQRACLRAVALQKDFASTANLGHSYLLAGDSKTAYEHYRDSAALLTSRNVLEQGPLKDFTLFIEKKWKPQESAKARDWFLQAYAQQENRAALMPRIFKLLKTKPVTRNMLIRHFPATKADEQVIAAYEIGDYTLAAKQAEKIKAGKKEKDVVVAARLNNLAISLAALGDHAQALKLLERAAAMASQSKDIGPAHAVAILNNFALAQNQKGTPEKALATMRRAFALSIKQIGPTHAHTRASAANLGALYEKNGSPEKAASLYQRLLEETNEHTQPIDDHAALASRISWIAQSAKTGEGREWHDRSLAAITSAQATPSLDMAAAFNNLAAYQSLTGDQSALLAHLQQAHNIREKLLGNTHPAALANLRVLALANWSANRIADADVLFDRYVTLMERRCSQTNCVSIPHVDGYKDYAQFLGEQGQMEKAYRLFELSKLRPLMKSILPRAAQLTLPAEKSRELGVLQERFIHLENQLEKVESAEKRKALLAQKERIAGDLTALHLKLNHAYPRYAQWTTPTVTPSLEALKQLSPESVFLNYLVNDDHLFALIIDAKGQMIYRDLGTPKALRPTLLAYHAALSQKQGVNTYATVSSLQAMLSQTLIAPLRDVLQNKSRWIVSPDAPFTQLPFETLKLDEALTVKAHDMHYIPSLAAYAALKLREAEYARTPRTKTLLVMSAIGRESTGEGAADMAGDAVGKLFTDQEASLYLDEQSKPAQLDRLNALGKLKNYRYFLFAAEDGRFTNMGPRNADWLSYQLHSDLLVLPPATQRESLPFELSLAGNVNTLLPLWRTDETIKSEFLQRFFARLKTGEDQVKALNAVKREFLNNPLLSEPVHWAPFLLHGV